VQNVTEANQCWTFASPWYSFKDVIKSTSNIFTHGCFYIEHRGTSTGHSVEQQILANFVFKNSKVQHR